MGGGTLAQEGTTRARNPAKGRGGVSATSLCSRAVRLLCISDIHGHEEALAAVLATAEQRGYTQILVAGDLCYPGPAPLETFRRLTQVGAVCVQGLGDRAIAMIDPDKVNTTSDHERHRLARLVEVRRQLGDLVLARLARLPPTVRIPLDDGGELLLVHGSPVDPMEPLSHDMSDAELLALLGDDPADVVVCGGSHVPFDRTVGGVRIVNVGSVGEAPRGNGPFLHADATLIEVTARTEGLSIADAVRVEQIVVPLGQAA